MAARIVCVFNQKGGCAKTMTTMQVGGAFGLMGKKTLIVDMDPQGTSSIWSSQAAEKEPFPASVVSMALHKERMIAEIKKFVDSYDIILIDCPPAIDSQVPWAALHIADIAIIPVIPVMDNIWASREARGLAMRAKQVNTSLRTFYLASVVRRGNLFKLCLDQIDGDPDVPMLSSSLSMRNAYPESQVFGSTVHSSSKSSPAAAEVDLLAQELLSILEI